MVLLLLFRSYFALIIIIFQRFELEGGGALSSSIHPPSTHPFVCVIISHSFLHFAHFACCTSLFICYINSVYKLIDGVLFVAMTSIFSSPSPHSSSRKRAYDNTSSHHFAAQSTSCLGSSLKRRRDSDEEMWVSPFSNKRVCGSEENHNNGSVFPSQTDREIRAMR